MKLHLPCLAALALTCAAVAPASAAFVVSVTDQVTAQLDGTYRYEYTLSVDPTSTLSAIDFDLNIDPGANLTAITTPSGWTVDYTPGDPLIYWSTTFDGNTVIAPGTSGVFAFTSAYAPGSRSFSTFGVDLNTFDFDIAGGTVNAPSFAPVATEPVPEPASAVLLLIGVAGAGLCARRRPRVA